MPAGNKNREPSSDGQYSIEYFPEATPFNFQNFNFEKEQCIKIN